MPGTWGVFDEAFAGVDQGTDWSGAGAIPALGPGTVTDVGSSHIVEGGNWPYLIYHLDQPPPGDSPYVYVAENFNPTRRVGAKLTAGESVGTAAGKYPYIEVGFNKTAKGWNAVAPLGGATQAGTDMLNYIRSVTSQGGGLPSGSGLPAPSSGSSGTTGGTQTASLLGSPVGTTEAIVIRLGLFLAGGAFLVLALILVSKAATGRTVLTAAAGFAAGKTTAGQAASKVAGGSRTVRQAQRVKRARTPSREEQPTVESI